MNNNRKKEVRRNREMVVKRCELEKKEAGCLEVLLAHTAGGVGKKSHYVIRNSSNGSKFEFLTLYWQKGGRVSRQNEGAPRPTNTPASVEAVNVYELKRRVV